VDRESLRCFPASHRAFTALQITCNLLPRFQRLLWSVPPLHAETPAENYSRSRAAKLGAHECQWNAFWMIFHPPGVLRSVKRSDMYAPEPAKVPDQPSTSSRTTAMDSRMSTLTIRGSILSAGPFLSIQSKRKGV